MSAPANRTAGNGGPRVANRYKTFLPCSLEQDGALVRVHVLNLSVTGALIATPAAIPARQPISLQFQAVSLKATVVWSRTDRAGLRYSLPLPQSTLEELIA